MLLEVRTQPPLWMSVALAGGNGPTSNTHAVPTVTDRLMQRWDKGSFRYGVARVVSSADTGKRTGDGGQAGMFLD